MEFHYGPIENLWLSTISVPPLYRKWLARSTRTLDRETSEDLWADVMKPTEFQAFCELCLALLVMGCVADRALRRSRSVAILALCVGGMTFGLITMSSGLWLYVMAYATLLTIMIALRKPLAKRRRRATAFVIAMGAIGVFSLTTEDSIRRIQAALEQHEKDQLREEYKRGLKDEYQRILQNRKKFPLSSLHERLAYEKTCVRNMRSKLIDDASQESESEATGTETNPHALPEAIQERLIASEEHYQVENERNAWLRYLHHAQEREFENVPGFGVNRMYPLTSRLGLISAPDTAEPPSIDEPPITEESSFITMNGQTLRHKGASAALEMREIEPPKLDALLTFHDAGQNSFLKPDRFGYVTSYRQVAGFLPHAFRTHKPDLRDTDQQIKWSIRRFELVSLLKHDTPRVYMSEKLPDLERLKHVPTRPLDEFEAASLPKLYHQEDVVFRVESDRLLMLGSLRANQQCLQCHEVNRAELLGAFSYELRPVKANPENSQPAAGPSLDSPRPTSEAVENLVVSNLRIKLVLSAFVQPRPSITMLF